MSGREPTRQDVPGALGAAGAVAPRGGGATPGRGQAAAGAGDATSPRWPERMI